VDPVRERQHRYGGDYSEEWRRICEARGWLRRGYTDKESVRELRRRIAAKRGGEAAGELIEEMRAQWAKRDEWHYNDNGREQ